MRKFLLLSFMFLSFSVLSSEVSTNGWGADLLSPQKKILGIVNNGDDGGILKLTCSEKTKQVSISYTIDGVPYDFYVIRKFGDTSSKSEGKALIGPKILTQAGLYSFILEAKGGFSIMRYPVGTKSRWEYNLEHGRDEAQYIPEGEEFFITGEILFLQIEEMVKTCPFNPGDKTPLF